MSQATILSGCNNTMMPMIMSQRQPRRTRRPRSLASAAMHLTVILATFSTILHERLVAQIEAAAAADQQQQQQHQMLAMPSQHHYQNQQHYQTQPHQSQNAFQVDQLQQQPQQRHPQQGGGDMMAVASSSSALSAPIFKDLSGPTSGKIQSLDVICGKNFMTVRAEFSGPFYGIVFSKGTYGQDNCIYVKPNSGLTHAAFNVYYDQCGTKPELQKKFYENTIVIQYGSDIIEAYDEAKRLRCEWFEAYEKPATFKPAIPVADLEVVEMNFQGDDIDCWMEIQEGTGPMSREVSKIVPVGQPMTIVVAINDYNGQFDMRVKSCVAHDGVQQPIALTDEYGCVLRPKMLTAFQKVRNPGGIHKKATILSYSRFLAFKFPDSMTVQIQCTVEVCRHGCADACQRIPSIAATTLQPELSLTAKWPANSNQPAISDMSSINRAAHRPQFQDGPVPAPIAQPEAPPMPSGSSDDMSGSESNQQPSLVATVNALQQQQQQHRRSQDSQRHHPVQMDGRIPQYLAPMGGHDLNQNRRPPPMPLHGARLPTSTTTSTSTTSTTTTTTTSTPQTTTVGAVSESNQAEENNNRALPADDSESPVDSAASEPNAQEQASSSDNSKSDQDNAGQQSGPQQEQSQPAVASVEQSEDNKPEASQPKPALVEAPAQSNQDQQAPTGQQQQAQEQPQAGGEQSATGNSDSGKQQVDQMAAESSEIKPSVQGDDEQQTKKDDLGSPNQLVGDLSQGSSGQSSLKTVEVEIPANEDPVRAFMSDGQNQQGPSQNSFSSVRLSSSNMKDLSGVQQPASYDSVMFENSRYQDQVMVSNNKDQSIIQPREKANEKATPNDQAASEDPLDLEATAASQLAGGSGKMRFGARSQPQQHSQASNHQPSGGPSASSALDSQPSVSSGEISAASESASSSMNKDGSSSASAMNPDRILLDRSDTDASSLVDLMSSASSSSESNSKVPSSGETSSQLDSVDSSTSSASSSKIMPVVGTDELATGPIQIEDRMGGQAPPSSPGQHQQSESLEEALTRLQQQIPQTAALVSGESASSPGAAAAAPATSQQSESNANSAQPRYDSAAQPSELERRDQLASKNQRSGSQQQNHKAEQSTVSQQPHPNVAGQAKVIPEPTSGLMQQGQQRGQMQMQASNQEGVAVAVAAINPVGMQQKHPQQQVGPNNQMQQQQANNFQQQQQQQAKPVAQVTNVPVGISFAQSQIPAIQQLQQQLAQQFQQQQQQQQQLTAQQQQQSIAKPARSRFNLLSPQAALQAVASRLMPKSQQQQQSNQRLPQVSQQQLAGQLFNSMQITPEQHKLFGREQGNFMVQPQQRPMMSAGPPLNQPQTQPKGLFSRLTSGLHPQHNQQQQQQPPPLVRNRRSPLEAKGDNRGELGLARSFMVVTGMDLAFTPSLNDSDLPQILNGHKMGDKSVVAKRVLSGGDDDDDDDEVIYGVCMPIVSLTFVLTCAFWLIVFLFSFCIYLFIKSRKQQRQQAMDAGLLKAQVLTIDDNCQSSSLTM